MDQPPTLSPAHILLSCIFLTGSVLVTIALHELTHFAAARLLVDGDIRITHHRWAIFQIETVEAPLTPRASQFIAAAPLIVGSCVFGLLIITPGFAVLRQVGGATTTWVVSAHLVLYSHLSPTDCRTLLWPKTSV